jgi:DNA-binding transcriptional MerR regulator
MAALVLDRDDKLMQVSEVADHLNLTPATIRWYANTGRLTVYLTDRGVRLFKLSDVQDFERDLIARRRNRTDDWTRKD